MLRSVRRLTGVTQRRRLQLCRTHATAAADSHTVLCPHSRFSQPAPKKSGLADATKPQLLALLTKQTQKLKASEARCAGQHRTGTGWGQHTRGARRRRDNTNQTVFVCVCLLPLAALQSFNKS